MIQKVILRGGISRKCTNSLIEKQYKNISNQNIISSYKNDKIQHSNILNLNNSQKRLYQDLTKRQFLSRSLQYQRQNNKVKGAKNLTYNNQYFFTTYNNRGNNHKKLTGLSILLNQTNEHEYLLSLFNKIKNIASSAQSTSEQKTNLDDSQNLTQSQSQTKQKHQKITTMLYPLTKLAEILDFFIIQLDLQQISEIDKFNLSSNSDQFSTGGNTRQSRQSLLIQINERKLFYKRLHMFLQNVIKQMQIQLKDNTSSNKNIKKQQKSTLLQGDFFRHSFVTQNYMQIYEQVKQSKQQYLLKSKKLKSFNILKPISYESNYPLKLRLIILILGKIKNIYQNNLLQISYRFQRGQISESQLNATGNLGDFLSSTIISPSEYSILLNSYFNQFSQEHIKNYLFMSIGHHSSEISELSKQLVDVKIRQTQFYFNIQKLSQIYRINQNEWLYNREGGNHDQQQQQNNDSIQEYKSPNKIHEQQSRNKLNKAFQTNKQLTLNFSKVIIKQLNKQKQKQKKQLSFQTKNHQKSSLNYIKYPSSILTNLHKKHILMTKSYNINLNKLLPHSFFNITDVQQISPLIEEHIMPIIFNPAEMYQDFIEEITKIKNSELINQAQRQKYNQLFKNMEIQLVQDILTQIQQNMLFLSRFLSWNFAIFQDIQSFINLFYQNHNTQVLEELKAFNLIISNNVSTKHDKNNIHLTNIQNDSNNKIRNTNKFKHLRLLTRVLNVIYQLKNNVNPIYIEDFIQSNIKLDRHFRHCVNSLSLNLNISPYQLVQLFDNYLSYDYTFHNIISSSIQKYDVLNNYQPLLKLRVLSTFLDIKFINYQEFYNVFLENNHLKILNPYRNNQNIPNYSDGFEKNVKILTSFNQNSFNQFRNLCQKNNDFKQYAQKVLETQKVFNKVITLFQFPQNITNVQIDNKNTSKAHDFNKKTHLIWCKLLQFYQKNDLMYNQPMTDEEMFLNWVSLYGNTNSNQNKSSQLASIQLTTFPDNINFVKLKTILRTLSENNSFLSSTINLTYFRYLKDQISQLHAFDKFCSVWNYPFMADIAISKTRFNSQKQEFFYIKTLPVIGSKGRGRFFNQESSLKKSYMGFINLQNQLVQQQLNLDHIYGLYQKQNQIIQFRGNINKGSKIISKVQQWLQGQLVKKYRTPLEARTYFFKQSL